MRAKVRTFAMSIARQICIHNSLFIQFQFQLQYAISIFFNFNCQFFKFFIVFSSFLVFLRRKQKMSAKKKAKSAGEWQFKVDLRKSDDDDSAWQGYSAHDNGRIETACRTRSDDDDDFELNSTYSISFAEMIQFRVDDRERQRPIRRVDAASGDVAVSVGELPAGTGVKKVAIAVKKVTIVASDDDEEDDDEDDEDDEEDDEKVWQWKSDTGWETYDDDDNRLLTKLRRSGHNVCKTDQLSFGVAYGTTYQIDFKKLTQTNLDSGTVRSIRRSKALDDDAAFATLIKAKSAAWGSLSDDAAATSSKKKGKKAAAAAVAAPFDPKSIVTRESSMIRLAMPTAPDAAFLSAQAALGPQSKRPHKSATPKLGYMVEKDDHGTYCFMRMLENEERLCGEFAVFYHSYSLAALLYEVQAAVAAVLFRFRSNFASLPRLLKAPFEDVPDAPALLKLFNSKLSSGSRDHDPRFRAVGICATTTLLGPDPEAPPTTVFLAGYSCGDLSFMGVLEQLLIGCSLPKSEVSALAKKIIKLSEEAGLDVSQFGGKPCKSHRPGHLLQIFLKRELVDRFAYAAFPYGPQDKKRTPLSDTLASNTAITGQVRICFNPSVFMRAGNARMFVYSADPTYHERRSAFQEKLRALLSSLLGTRDGRLQAALAIHGGVLPDWFEADDQTSAADALLDNVFK
jgi:hypothetical protein